MGNRWANISKQFPGRTDNNLKNFFYSSLRRAIRQINYFVGHYKKKSNIKPFKQSILTKILNISDQKYRQKLDIKSNKADDLAQSTFYLIQMSNKCQLNYHQKRKISSLIKMISNSERKQLNLFKNSIKIVRNGNQRELKMIRSLIWKNFPNSIILGPIQNQFRILNLPESHKG